MLFAEDLTLNVISRMDTKDVAFKEYQKKVDKSYEFFAKNPGRAPDVEFYIYYAEPQNSSAVSDLLALASRCNLRYETLSTLNRIGNLHDDISGKRIILPTANGIFAPETPATTLESLMKKKCFSNNNAICYNVNGVDFVFLPDEKFNPTERAFFLDVAMRSPLPEGILSSDYGSRISPISGKQHFHGGIDLAAPEGTLVSSCKAGVVLQVGYDDVYGNFILLSHDGSNQSLYGHLSAVLVKEGQTVLSGAHIAKVGTTGASTGPHLHFEIRSGKQKINPRLLIK